jgi:hypothetical protein
MYYWFAVSNDIVDDPKLAMIAKHIELPRHLVLAVWLYILREANKSDERGCIARLNCDEASFALDVSMSDFSKVVIALSNRQIIEFSEDSVPNSVFYDVTIAKFAKWQKIAENNSNREYEKVRKQEYRAKKRDYPEQSQPVPDLSRTKWDCPGMSRMSRHTVHNSTLHNIHPESPPPPLGGSRESQEAKTKRSKPASKAELDEMIDAYTDNPALAAELKTWVGERKTVIKKPLSVEAVKRNLNELTKLGGADDSKRIAIVAQSIANSWQGFFAIKSAFGTSPPKPEPKGGLKHTGYTKNYYEQGEET